MTLRYQTLTFTSSRKEKVMGLFDELDVAGAEDDTWAIPDNTYACTFTDVVAKKYRNDNMGTTFRYKITEGDLEGREISEYKRTPHSEDAEPLTGKAKADAIS